MQPRPEIPGITSLSAFSTDGLTEAGAEHVIRQGGWTEGRNQGGDFYLSKNLDDTSVPTKRTMKNALLRFGISCDEPDKSHIRVYKVDIKKAPGSLETPVGAKLDSLFTGGRTPA